MPRVFDNINLQLLSSLQNSLTNSNRADFCVGYFNLRGWKQLASHIEPWQGGEGNCCRLLVGMLRPPHEELRSTMSLNQGISELDNQTALTLKKSVSLQNLSDFIS